MSQEAKVRWGILSSANIAVKVTKAIHASRKGEVIAVASRSLDKAQAFATANNIPKAYGSYEELLDDPAVEVVYIPLPSTLKREWAVKAAQRGKHILVEKPFTSAEDLNAMLTAATEAGVQFMDGTMWVHHPRVGKIKELLVTTVAPLARITSAFTAPVSSTADIRYNKDLEPLGALGDLGWYNVRFSLFARGYQEPQRVACTGTIKDGVPVVSNCTLFWDGDEPTVASFDNAFASWRQWAELAGSNSSIYIHDFVVPYAQDPLTFPERTQEAVIGLDLIDAAGRRETILADEDGLQEVNMIDNFCFYVRTMSIHQDYFTQPYVTQRVLDALMRSLAVGGRVVPVDDAAGAAM